MPLLMGQAIYRVSIVDYSGILLGDFLADPDSVHGVGR